METNNQMDVQNYRINISYKLKHSQSFLTSKLTFPLTVCTASMSNVKATLDQTSYPYCKGLDVNS